MVQDFNNLLFKTLVLLPVAHEEKCVGLRRSTPDNFRNDVIASQPMGFFKVGL